MSKPKALSMLKKLGMGQLLGPKSKRPSLWLITFIDHVGFCEEMFKRKEQFFQIFLCLQLLRRQVLLGLGFAHGAWAFYIVPELLTWGLGFQDFEPEVSHPSQAIEGLCTSMFVLHKVSMTQGYICMDNQTQGPLAN